MKKIYCLKFVCCLLFACFANNLNAQQASNEAMLEALSTSADSCKILIIKRLGFEKYLPAVDAISVLAGSINPEIQKSALSALSQIASPHSEEILASAAEKAEYNSEQTNATESYFNYLTNLSQSGQQDFIAQISKKLIKKLKTPEQTTAKAAALKLYALSAGNSAIGEISNALKDNDKLYREAALLASNSIQSPKMDQELIQQAKKIAPDRQVEIIQFFEMKGDTSVYPSILKFLTSKDENVMSAAIMATGRLGTEKAITSIIKTMNISGNQQVVNSGEKTLVSIKSPKVVTEAVNAIPQVTPMVKVALINILAQKQANQYSSVIFNYTLSDNKPVRDAAYTALKKVVTKDNLEALSSQLTLPLEKDQLAAVQDAMYNAIKEIGTQDQQADSLLSIMQKTENKEVYFRPLALVGGKKNLKIISEYIQNQDTKIQTMAFEALTEWNGSEAAPILFCIAELQPGRKIFDQALMGYITRISQSDFTDTQKLLLLRKALDIAVSAEQKKAILEQIAKTGTFIGMMTAGKYLNDVSPDVKNTAVQAIISIALSHKAYYGKEVTTLLNKVIAINTGQEAENQNQTIQKHLAEMPQGDGWKSIFNGKDLTGWKGLVENPIARAKMRPSILAEKQQKANDIMRRHWKVEKGSIVFDGKGYDNLCTEGSYNDFELYLDWKISPKGNAGIYLRGTPQIQICDASSTNADIEIGSGGLKNNQVHSAKPLIVADNPVSEWNSFYIRMVDENVTVYLNGKLVVDNIPLENYWSRKEPIFPTGQLELEAHNSPAEYRDIYIKEIPQSELLK